MLSDPAVAHVGSSVGASTFNASVNNGRLFIALKPPRERGNVTSQQVINRLRPKLLDVGGMRVFMFPAQDVRAGGRQSSSSFQFTLWSADLDELLRQVPRVVAKMQALPELVDVTTDREQNGLQANVVIDRTAASRLGVRIQDIDNALNNAFSQRQISTIYSERNQYRVILEVDPLFSRDPSDLAQVYVDGRGRRAGAAVERRPRREDAGAAGHQPPGPVPGGDHHLQSRAQRHDRGGVARRSTRRWRSCICRTRSAPSSPATPRRISVRSARSRW